MDGNLDGDLDSGSQCKIVIETMQGTLIHRVCAVRKEHKGYNPDACEN